MARLIYTVAIGIPACLILMTLGCLLFLTVVGIPLALTCFALGNKVLTLK